MPDKENELFHVAPAVLDKLNDSMPPEETLCDLSELFKIFGDSTRIKILYLLLESEMCVNDISALLSMNQSAISHQLRILKPVSYTHLQPRYRSQRHHIPYSFKIPALSQ